MGENRDQILVSQERACPRYPLMTPFPTRSFLALQILVSRDRALSSLERK